MSGPEMLVLLIVLGLVIGLVLVGANKLSSNDGASKRTLRRALVSEKQKNSIAVKALNDIARTGNTLEAEVALDKINQLELKELES